MASALCRLAQPQPALVARIWASIRRVLWSVQAAAERLDRDGAQLWAQARAEEDADADPLVQVLRSAIELDSLGDALATWAADVSGERPDAQAAMTLDHIEARLDAAGVPHEPREAPPRGRAGRGV